MKKLVLPLLILIALIIATGAVSANNPQPDQFTIIGNSTGYEYKILSNNRTTVFNASAAGESDGYLEGSFTFAEWGQVDLNVENGAGSGKGTNTGLVTITRENAPRSQAVIWYGGQLDAFAQKVRGSWYVVKGKGKWDDLKGHGNYTGSAGADPFTVVFTGDFD